MATLSDGFKDIFLAGIGAMAITGEKTKDLVDQLISKGELTVDQGKQINTELKHKAEDVAASVRYDVLEARMAAMTPEERAAFVAKAAEFAEKARLKWATLPRCPSTTRRLRLPRRKRRAPSARLRAARPCRRTRCCAIFSAPVRRSIPRIGSI